jgi:DNA-binding NarL/FixJ family response regulator
MPSHAPGSIKIVVADDHALIRQGLRALLGTEPAFKVVSEAADGSEALRQTVEYRPDVLITDLIMPGLHGFEVVLRVRQACPGTRIVVISMQSDEGYVTTAFRHGALAYVCKDDLVRHLRAAVWAVLAGRCFWVPPLPSQALSALAENPVPLEQTP